jgi:hypothetical protein
LSRLELVILQNGISRCVLSLFVGAVNANRLGVEPSADPYMSDTKAYSLSGQYSTIYIIFHVFHLQYNLVGYCAQWEYCCTITRVRDGGGCAQSDQLDYGRMGDERVCAGRTKGGANRKH